MVWWSLVEKIALVLSGGLVSYGAEALRRRWTRADRQEDRDEARREKHEDDLRRAYAEFAGACTTLFDRARLMSGFDAAIRASEARHENVSDELRDRDRLALEDFWLADTNAEIKAMAVLLLETDASKQAQVCSIAGKPWPYSEADGVRDGIEGASRDAERTYGGTCRFLCAQGYACARGR